MQRLCPLKYPEQTQWEIESGEQLKGANWVDKRAWLVEYATKLGQATRQNLHHTNLTQQLITLLNGRMFDEMNGDLEPGVVVEGRTCDVLRIEPHISALLETVIYSEDSVIMWAEGGARDQPLWWIKVMRAVEVGRGIAELNRDKMMRKRDNV